jgi:ABC-2 type transport system permease protein
MTRLLRAEALRLRTTRAYWLLAAGAIVLIAGGAAPTAAASSFSPGDSPARIVLAIAGLAQTVALIAGALSVTGEFRHKTITLAILITPCRTPLLAARHIPASITGTQAAAIVAGGGMATALFAAIGVGAGAIIRNQAGALITVLAVLYVAEPLLGFIPGLGTAIQRYGLGGLASAATRTTGFPASAHLLGQGAAALVLAGYATAVLLAGAALLRRRDILT